MEEMVPREVQGKPSTPRVKDLWELLYSSKPRIDSERCKLYTDYLKEHWRDPPCIKQGGALDHVLSNLTPVINDGELIVGQISRYFRGTQLYPEYEAWILEEFRGITRPEERYAEGSLWEVEPGEEERKIGIFLVSQEEAKIVKDSAEFWDGKDLRSITEKFFLAHEEGLLETFKRYLAIGLVAPPGVMWDVPEGRVICDYEKVLKSGLEGVIDLIQEKMMEMGMPSTKEELHRWDFYLGAISACEGVIKFAERYADEAHRLAEDCQDDKRREELFEIERICRKVPKKPSESFREALQSFWFVHTALFIELNGRGISPGRFDQYMYPFYKKDVDRGKIKKEEALELLELLRIKFTQIVRAHPTATEGTLGGSIYQNMTLGGLDEEGEGADNELSSLILQAGINAKTHQPTLSVRWSEKISHDFKIATINCIKAGSGYPAIFCEDPAIWRFVNVTKAPMKDALDWAPCGCVDMQICGKRTPMDAINHINLPKVLEIILNNGRDPISGKKIFTLDIDPFSAGFEELLAEFKIILREVIETLGKIENVRMLVHNEIAGLALPFCSVLLDDCIEKGLHCQEGGCVYNDSPYFISCGMINVANSFSSIKKNAFEEKRFTMEDLSEAFKNNFQGMERIRKLCLSAPKFGNDEDYVDLIAKDLYDAFSEMVQDQKNWMGDPYRPSTLSVTTQVTLGKAVGALPDGREAFAPLADGALSPFPGTDVNGPTAVLKSACKIDAKNLQSTLLNLKFNPKPLWSAENSEKFIAFNDAYAELGGYHIQYNVIDSKMLRDAQAHPDRYADLMVRVAGFTARFVELGKDVQDEIIKRTEYKEV